MTRLPWLPSGGCRRFDGNRKRLPWLPLVADGRQPIKPLERKDLTPMVAVVAVTYLVVMKYRSYSIHNTLKNLYTLCLGATRARPRASTHVAREGNRP